MILTYSPLNNVTHISVLILIFSYYFSCKLVNILIYKVKTYKDDKDDKDIILIDRIYKLLKTPDKRWWPIFTYIVKAYITLYYFIHIVPYSNNYYPLMAILLIDILHIFISITYNIYEFTPFLIKLDYISINAKICINALSVFMIHHSHLDQTYWYISMFLYINIFTLIMITYLFNFRFKVDGMLCKTTALIMYMILYGLNIGPILYHNLIHENNNSVYIFAITYSIGLLTWVFNIPEILFKNTLFNACGFMHIFISIADIYLIDYLY